VGGQSIHPRSMPGPARGLDFYGSYVAKEALRIYIHVAIGSDR
jgi:hypothetical protein